MNDDGASEHIRIVPAGQGPEKKRYKGNQRIGGEGGKKEEGQKLLIKPGS